MVNEIRSEKEIRALSQFIQKLLADNEFDEQDVELWTGVTRGLDWVLKEGPPMERALTILRTSGRLGKI